MVMAFVAEQVHRGVLNDGREVAVKVLRPNMEPVLRGVEKVFLQTVWMWTFFQILRHQLLQIQQ